MSERSKKMYKDSPKLERGEDGKMSVKKKNAEETAGAEGAERNGEHGEMKEAMPTHVRHSMERADMHKRHEAEHMMHDHHGSGPKEEMHGRHEKELKSMHGRHEKEIEEDKVGPKGEKEGKEPKAKEKTGEKVVEKVKKDEKE